MTDRRAVVEAPVEQYVDEFLMPEGREAIEKALADARRQGMEEAAKVADEMASAEQALYDDHANRLHRHARHIAATIATAIRAQAQADKEG